VLKSCVEIIFISTYFNMTQIILTGVSEL